VYLATLNINTLKTNMIYEFGVLSAAYCALLCLVSFVLGKAVAPAQHSNVDTFVLRQILYGLRGVGVLCTRVGQAVDMALTMYFAKAAMQSLVKPVPKPVAANPASAAAAKEIGSMVKASLAATHAQPDGEGGASETVDNGSASSVTARRRPRIAEVVPA
jgi:hypothetical protein